MTAIVILATSFFIAVVGLVQNNRATTEKRSLLGMTPLGFLLVVVAALGFIVSGAKQTVDSRESIRLRQQAEADTKLLRIVNAKIDYIIAKTKDPSIAQQLNALKDEMNVAASRSRRSDFSLSDFTMSRFDNGNFTLSYFAGALFREANFDGARFDGADFRGAIFTGAHVKYADFRGVDLSGIIIDEDTVLPKIN